MDCEELVQQEMVSGGGSLADKMKPFMDSNMMSMTFHRELCGSLPTKLFPKSICGEYNLCFVIVRNCM